jgi:hypothetical protein
MEQPGIMLYGYRKTDAHLIKDALEAVVKNTIILLSGSCRESHILEDILSDEKHTVYEDNEPKVLMFLGFDDDQINSALENFPGADKVPRPIFCVPTENNISWPLHQLLEHLVEERNYRKNTDRK